MNVNFILITPRVESGADLHLGVYLHFPGTPNACLIAYLFLLHWWDACRESLLCHLQRTQEASCRWVDMVLGLLTKDLTDPTEPATLERAFRDRTSRFHHQEEAAMGTYGLWAVAAMAVLES